MIGRVFVRLLLVIYMALSVWALNWIWTTQRDLNVSERVFFSIIVSAILVSAISLLIESIRSFSTLTVRKNSFWYILLGYSLMEDEKNRPRAGSIKAHYCALFLARSFMLALLSLILIGLLCVPVLAVMGLIGFILNPFMPALSIGPVLNVIGIVLFAVIVVVPILMFHRFLDEKLNGRNRVIRTVVHALFVCISFGPLFGAFVHLVEGVATGSLMESVGLGIVISLSIASFFGAIIALAYGIYWLVGKASARYSVFGNIWNTLCPVRQINIT